MARGWTSTAVGRTTLALSLLGVGLGLVELVRPGTLEKMDSRVRRLQRHPSVRAGLRGMKIVARSPWARAAGLQALERSVAQGLRGGRIPLSTAAGLGGLALAGAAPILLLASRGSHDGVVHVERSVTVNKPVDEVYASWRNLEDLPRRMVHVESVGIDGDRSHWRVKAPAGLTVEWDATLVEEVPNERLAWKSADDADVPNSGTVRFVAAPDGRGTEVHAEVHYELPGGRLGVALAKILGGEPAEQIESDLRRFKQVMETGEVQLSSPRRGDAAR